MLFPTEQKEFHTFFWVTNPLERTEHTQEKWKQICDDRTEQIKRNQTVLSLSG